MTPRKQSRRRRCRWVPSASASRRRGEISRHTQQIRLFPNDSKSTQKTTKSFFVRTRVVCAPPQKSLFFFNKMQQRSFFHSSFFFRGATMIRRSSPPSVSSQRLVLQSSSSRSLCVLTFYYCFFCVVNSTVLPPLNAQTKQIKKKRCVKFRVSNEDVLLLCFLFSCFFGDKIRDEDDTTFEREREREREGRQEAKALCGQRREGRKEGASRRGKGTLFFSSSSPGSSSSEEEEEESTRIYISLVVLECD